MKFGKKILKNIERTKRIVKNFALHIKYSIKSQDEWAKLFYCEFYEKSLQIKEVEMSDGCYNAI